MLNYLSRMRLKKMQHGGRPSPSSRDAIPQYGSMEEYMSLSPYERGGSGAVENTFGPEDYILGAFPLARALSPAAKAIGKYLGLGKKAAPKPTSVPRRPLTYNEMGPQQLSNRFDDALQYRASRALNEAATEDVVGQLNVQRQAQDVVDQLNLEGAMDKSRYQEFLKSLEDLFNASPGGTVTKESYSTANQLVGPVTDLMKQYGLEVPPDVAQKLANSLKPFQMNANGGRIGKKIKVLKKEGRPHDQAVAIALSMRDRGEL